jgi:two-component system catabolic regulation response regulator CreB
VAYALKRDGFLVSIAATFADAERGVPDADLLVLDLMLPDGSGFDLIVRMRREGRLTPIIVLSSRDGEADRVAALETGADDYVTKPFSPSEVVARVRAVLRRAAQAVAGRAPGEAELPISVDDATRRAQVSGKEIELTRVEFDLLASLLESPGRVYTRAQLIDRVWGDGFAISDRTIDSHVKALRKKVAEAGGDPGLLETVRGVGYRVTDRPADDGDDAAKSPKGDKV